MKKADFLNNYAKYIWQTSVSINKSLYHCIYSPYNKTVQIKEGSYLLNGWDCIQSEEELRTLLDTKQFFVKNSGAIFPFLKNILLQSNIEELSYFFSHSAKLIYSINLEELNLLLPLLTEEKIHLALQESDTNLWQLGFNKIVAINQIGQVDRGKDIENLFINVQHIPKIEKSLAIFLSKRLEQLKHEYEYENIKEKITRFFPHSLENFSVLPFINHYLDAQKANIFLDNIEETLLVTINVNVLKNKIPIKSFLTTHYSQSLSLLNLSLSDKNNMLGINYIDSTNPKKDEYLNLYINFKHNHLHLTKDDFKKIISDYFYYIQNNNDIIVNNHSRESLKMIKKWVNSYVQHFKLENDLNIKNINYNGINSKKI